MRKRKIKKEKDAEQIARDQLNDAALVAFLPLAVRHMKLGSMPSDRLWVGQFTDEARKTCLARYQWTPAQDEFLKRLRVLRDEVRQLIDHVRRFFAGQVGVDGKPLTDAALITVSGLYVVYQARLVEDGDAPSGTQIAYDMIDRHLDAGHQLVRNPITDRKNGPSRLYLSLVTRCRRLDIPVEYQAGTILLYLWLCEGVVLGQESNEASSPQGGNPGRALGRDRGEPAGAVPPPDRHGGGAAAGGRADDAVPEDHRTAA